MRTASGHHPKRFVFFWSSGMEPIRESKKGAPHTTLFCQQTPRVDPRCAKDLYTTPFCSPFYPFMFKTSIHTPTTPICGISSPRRGPSANGSDAWRFGSRGPARKILAAAAADPHQDTKMARTSCANALTKKSSRRSMLQTHTHTHTTTYVWIINGNTRYRERERERKRGNSSSRTITGTYYTYEVYLC